MNTLPLRLVISATLALMALPAQASLSASASDWPFYGHDLANTRTADSETRLSPLSAPTLAPLWSFKTAGDVTGTPAVVQGVVYTGTYGGVIYALDAKTGSLLWSQDNGGYDISSSVAVANGRVFYSDHGGRVGAIDVSTGAKLWQTDLSNGEWNVQLYGSPVPVETSIVIGISSLQEAEATVHGFHGGVAKLDASTGAIQWRTQTVCDACNGGAVWNTPAIDLGHRLVFHGTGNLYAPPADVHSDAIQALDLDTGALVWSHQFLKDDFWTQATGGPGPDFDFGASPNLFTIPDGKLAVGEGQKSGQYRVVDALTGSEIWTTKVAQGSALGGFLGSTAYWNGHLYAGLVNAGNGQPQEPTNLDSAPTGGKIVGLRDDGSIAWQWAAVPTLSAAAVANGVVLQGASRARSTPTMRS